MRALLARLDATAINSDGGGAATARADILLIDVSTSGAGTLAAFREQEKIAGAAPTPAIAVVAEPPPDGAGVPGGFDAYVVKPVTLDMLAEALARAQAARRLGSRSGE